MSLEPSLTLLEPIRVDLPLHQEFAEARHLDGIMHRLMKLLVVDGAALDDGEALLEKNGVVEQRGQQVGCHKHSMEGWNHNGTLVRAPDRNRLVGDETVDMGYLFRDIASIQSNERHAIQKFIEAVAQRIRPQDVVLAKE